MVVDYLPPLDISCRGYSVTTNSSYTTSSLSRGHIRRKTMVCRSAKDIEQQFKSCYEDVCKYFEQNQEKEDVEPYLVCTVNSFETFIAYVNKARDKFEDRLAFSRVQRQWNIRCGLANCCSRKDCGRV